MSYKNDPPNPLSPANSDHNFNETAWQESELDFARNFEKESWTLFGIATLLVILRVASRLNRFGLRGLKFDDALILIGWSCFLFTTYGFNFLLLRGGQNSFVLPEAIDAQLVAKIQQNMKWIFAGEHTLHVALWLAKICLLVIYSRITEGLQIRRWVSGVAAYTILAWIGVELSLIFTCWPVSNRWVIPAISLNCSCYTIHEINFGVLSLSSSLLILMIGLPIIHQVRLPPRQRWIVMILFGLGLFDIVAATCTRIYVANFHVDGFEYMVWYMREISVAYMVCNLPYVWALLSDSCPSLREWSSQVDMDSQIGFWEPREYSWWKKLRTTRKGSDEESRGSTVVHVPSESSKDLNHLPHSESFTDEARKVNEKMDALIVERMVRGELEDSVSVGMGPTIASSDTSTTWDDETRTKHED